MFVVLFFTTQMTKMLTMKARVFCVFVSKHIGIDGFIINKLIRFFRGKCLRKTLKHIRTMHIFMNYVYGGKCAIYVYEALFGFHIFG